MALADLIEEKCNEKNIINLREDNHFSLFEKEEDKSDSNKSVGNITVENDNKVNIVSTNFDVYQAAVEAAKARGAQKIQLTSLDAEGNPRDLSDSENGLKNRQALAHLFLACSKSGLEVETTPEIEDVLQDYPEYNTYKLEKDKEHAYKELNEKINSLSDADKLDYQNKKDAVKNAANENDKKTAWDELATFEKNNGIDVLKQKAKVATLNQYKYFIEHGTHFGDADTDDAKENRKNSLKDAIGKYQNKNGYYEHADSQKEVKGNKALEIAMYKRLLCEKDK